jgi:hypothetical protein
MDSILDSKAFKVAMALVYALALVVITLDILYWRA